MKSNVSLPTLLAIALLCLTAQRMPAPITVPPLEDDPVSPATAHADSHKERKATPKSKATAEKNSPAATPALWKTPIPPYPAQARVSHVQGTTVVRVTTDASGGVASVAIVKSTGSAILDANTQGYARNHWKGPANSTHEIPFEYRLH